MNILFRFYYSHNIIGALCEKYILDRENKIDFILKKVCLVLFDKVYLYSQYKLQMKSIQELK